MFELQGGMHGFSVDVWGNNILLTIFPRPQAKTNTRNASVWCKTWFKHLNVKI